MAELSKIVLQLEREDRATVFKKEERLQVSAYEKALRLLNSAHSFAKTLGNDNRRDRFDIFDSHQPLDRIHNTVFVHGGRGTGKTAFMLNLEKAYEEWCEDSNQDRRRLYFTQPIDPTLLSIKEDFIHVILGQLHSEILQHGKRRRQQLSEDYFQSMERVTNALAADFAAKKEKSFGADRLLDFQGSLELERRLYHYFEEAKNELDCDAIVLLIDDVDMSLEVAFKVLEVIRRYLACPHILPVVSGDQALYRTIIRRHFIKELSVNSSNPLSNETAQAEELALRYMQKIFPRQSQIQLYNFTQIIPRYAVNVDYQGKAILFNRLYTRLKKILFAGTNGREDSWPSFLPETSRDLSQLLNMLAMFVKQDSENAARLFDQDRVVIDNSLLQSIPLLTSFSDYFTASEQHQLSFLMETTSLLFRISNNEEEYRSLREVGLFDVANHGGFFYQHSLVEASKELLFHPIMSDISRQIQQERLNDLPTVTMEFPAVEPFNMHWMIGRARLEAMSGEDAILLRLYTHQEYYTSYQSGYLVFLGKVFEMVVTSIYHQPTISEVTALLDSAPYHSFFHYFPNSLISVDEAVLDLEEDESEDFHNLGDGDVALNELVDRIAKWREHYLPNAQYSAQLIYFAFKRYFNDIHLLKAKDFLLQRSVQELHTRIKYILANAFACYEQKAESVVSQSIAQNKNFSEETLQRADRSYSGNIRPLLDAESTLTAAIMEHPIFKIGSLEHFTIRTPRTTQSKSGPERKPPHLQQFQWPTEAHAQFEPKMELYDGAKATSSGSETVTFKSADETKAASAAQSDDKEQKPTDSSLVYNALIAVVSRDEIETLRHIKVDGEGFAFVVKILNQIFDSPRMFNYREEYNRQKTNPKSHFYTIYEAAKKFGEEDRLDAWLAGKI